MQHQKDILKKNGLVVTNTEKPIEKHQLVVKKYGTTKTIKMVRDQKNQCEFIG